LIPLLDRLAPNYVTTSERIGRTMLRAARTGLPNHTVTSADMH
jgi:hypothetical protein